MAHIGTPIVGDFKYGGQAAKGLGEIEDRLHLHARSIDIAHPDGGRLKAIAPLPPHMKRAWQLFGFDPDSKRDVFSDERRKMNVSRSVSIVKSPIGFIQAAATRFSRWEGGSDAGRQCVRAADLQVAEAVADEWRAQEDKINAATMLLTSSQTQLSTASRLTGALAVRQIAAFARSDLLWLSRRVASRSRRAPDRIWNPLLEWASATYGIRLQCGSGVTYIEQPADALVVLEQAISQLTDFELAACQRGRDIGRIGDHRSCARRWAHRPGNAFSAAQLTRRIKPSGGASMRRARGEAKRNLRKCL